MEYTVSSLAKLSGVSARTLRYYDQIGLLHPLRQSANGYRIYGQGEVDRLQQILFYRELGVSLEGIGAILDAPGYDREAALAGHLSALMKKRQRLELLIGNVEKTIRAMKGECSMNDTEKFEGFKQKLVEENEAAYGSEIRQKYGDAVVDASNAKLKGMCPEEYERVEALRKDCEALFKEALEEGDPAGDKAQRACDLHRQWISAFWKAGTYSKEAHLGLGEMYVADPRFQAYYDELAPGLAEFLHAALAVYCR